MTYNFKNSSPTVRVQAFKNPKGYETVQEVESAMCRMASPVKMIMGVMYGAVHYTMLDALDNIKNHPSYMCSVKHSFQLAKKAMDDNERSLLHTTNNRFFCVKDMPDEMRVEFRPDMTDKDYFQYWMDLGASAHKEYRQELLVLRHKYEKRLRDQGEKYSDIISWAIIAEIALEEAVKAYDDGVRKALATSFGIPKDIVDSVFSGFNLSRVLAAWNKAVCTLFPQEIGFTRDISLGIEQLEQALGRAIQSTDALMEATEDNSDLWADKQAFKKRKGDIRRIKRRMAEETN